VDTESDGQKKCSPSELQQELADEGEVLRWCIEWLEKLARQEKVVVNLRASIDPKTAYVSIDRQWVFRVLRRVAANLDQLSGSLFPTEESEVESNPITAGVKLRHRLAEPEPELSSLTPKRTTSYSEGKDGFTTNVKWSSLKDKERSLYHLNSSLFGTVNLNEISMV
jgi:hypothetical protein